MNTIKKTLLIVGFISGLGFMTSSALAADPGAALLNEALTLHNQAFATANKFARAKMRNQAFEKFVTVCTEYKYDNICGLLGLFHPVAADDSDNLEGAIDPVRLSANQKALKPLQLACRESRNEACLAYGIVLYNIHQKAEAVAEFKKLCTAGVSAACTRAAHIETAEVATPVVKPLPLHHRVARQ